MIKKFEAFKFEQTEKPKRDELYLFIMFEGGDADTEHPVHHKFKGIKFSEYEQHLDEINKVIDDYKKLDKILDINSAKFCEEYDEVEEKYGKDIAHLFEETPNDPQDDYQNKCYISRLTLVGYDQEGNKHESYV